MTSVRVPRLAPVPVYFIIMGVGTAFFMTYATIASVYRITEAGLNPLQLVLVGTVLEISTFLFEIPTGVVADVYSRRMSIILSFFLMGGGFILEGSLPVFWAILLAQVLWGVGFTFSSGAEEAWIADEVGNQGVGRIYLRGAQMGQLGSLAGIGASVALASIDLALPLVVAGILFIALGLVLTFIMPEKGFRPASRGERRSWQAMGQTFMGGARAIRRWPALAAIMAIALFYGASSEPLDRLWQFHLLESFTLPSIGGLDPVVWFGIISGGSLVLGIAFVEVVRRSLNVDDPRIAVRALFVINAAKIASVLVFALTGSFPLAFAVLIADGVFRHVSLPIFNAWTNQHLDPGVRATVFSMRAQSDSLGQIAAGPAIGAFATATTVRLALLSVAALLVPAQGIYAFAMRRRKGQLHE
ncbi:MAG: MFS transporter [Chloroflexi bacterium]|nr:MFS transporter [Chloroflexota bacterium]